MVQSNMRLIFSPDWNSKVTETLRLKNREDIQTTTAEVTTSSSDIADEEQNFL